MIRHLKRYLLFIAILFGFIFFSTLLFSVFFPKNQSTQIPNENDTNQTLMKKKPLEPLQKTIIGQTTDEEIQNQFIISSKETLPDGSIKYTIPSPLTSRPNNIITKDGVATYERSLTPDAPNKVGFMKSDEIVSIYGQPEKIYKGSLYYGWFAQIWIYPNQGIAATVNPNTSEVYEVTFFNPTTIDDYQKVYGEDIDPDPKGHEFQP